MEYKGITFKWEISKHIKKTIDYMLDNNYKIIKHKQYISKIILYIDKEDYIFEYEIYNGTCDFKMWVNNFERYFETHKQFVDLMKGAKKK